MRRARCEEESSLHGADSATVRARRTTARLRARTGTVPNPADGDDQLGLFRVALDL